jgi:hypothetical protein
VVKDYEDGDAEHTMLVTGNTDGYPVAVYALSDLRLPTE